MKFLLALLKPKPRLTVVGAEERVEIPDAEAVRAFMAWMATPHGKQVYANMASGPKNALLEAYKAGMTFERVK